MGLVKEVRDFFTGRINGVLNAKIEAISKNIDGKKLEAEAQARFEQRIGKVGVGKRITALIRKEAEVEEEKKALADELEKAVAPFSHIANNRPYHYGGGVPSFRYSSRCGLDAYEGWAELLESKQALDDLYPVESAEIKKIEALKKDVEAVVLLATSERKLVTQLAKVVKNYGGDISELLAILPDEV